MLDALLDGDHAAAFEHGSSAATKQDYVHLLLKLMTAALRAGEPSERMMGLLAAHIEKIKPEDATSVLGIAAKSSRPTAAFRVQVAIDTFICLCSDPDDPATGDPDDPENRAAMIAAYDAYFKGTGTGKSKDRTYASDLTRLGVEGAEQSMKNVIRPLLHTAGFLSRKAAGRKKIGA